MSEEKRALARHSAPPSEADYEAILAAVMETGRGRWFLHEFAQRNRHVETRGVLTAIQRLEGMLRTQGAQAPEPPGRPDADQILTAILRGQAMLGATDDGDFNVFDGVAQSIEATQVRMRGVLTRLQDSAAALREDGGQTRICNDLDRQVRDLDTGCAQLDDASGDIRILVAVLKEIESLTADSAPAARAIAPAAEQKPMPEALVVTPVAVPPQPQNDPVETGLMVSDTVSLEELEACVAEFEETQQTAAGERVETAAIEMPASIAATADLPSHKAIAADALIQSEPADFLLEPLPHEEPAQNLVPEAGDLLTVSEIHAEPEEKPLAPLRLDSFDPLAPLRALSDEEKIALFS